MAQYNLVGVGNNAKTIKGDNEIYLTAIMYMAPYDTATSLGHGGLICPYAEIAKCHVGCLYSAGRGQMNSVLVISILNGLLNYFQMYSFTITLK